jgi:hypothetical protein
MINLKKNISNLFGWRTDRKIIVIESDDWGSIRMPSREVFKILKNKGIELERGDAKRYNLNDTLASSKDLGKLFEVLYKYKDNNGRHPVFTAITIVANPDFEQIEKANFNKYVCEPFTETLKRYGRSDAFELWKQGLNERLFVPEFHAREHLNITSWLKALQHNNQEALLAFQHGMWGYNNQHKFGISFQAAFDIESLDEINLHKTIIQEGLILFEDLFGYKASYFVPPNGPFNNQLEEISAMNGIRYMAASKIQNEPMGNGKYRKRLHYIGQKNKYNQIYITRNCFFEPSSKGNNWVESCLMDIDNAFKWKKPAVISSHRVNYIGSLYENNRTCSLKELDFLLQKILTKWPEVEFETSVGLGDIIRHSK